MDSKRQKLFFILSKMFPKSPKFFDKITEFSHDVSQPPTAPPPPPTPPHPTPKRKIDVSCETSFNERVLE